MSKNEKYGYFERFCNMTDEDRNRYYIYVDENIMIGGKPEYVMELLETMSSNPSKVLDKALADLKMQLNITD